jgi:hypothetical protein
MTDDSLFLLGVAVSPSPPDSVRVFLTAELVMPFLSKPIVQLKVVTV